MPVKAGVAGACLAASFIAACGIVEPPGPPSTTTDLAKIQFQLTNEQPVVVRALDLVAVAGEMPVSGIEGFVSVNDQGGHGSLGKTHDDVWISILNSETGIGA